MYHVVANPHPVPQPHSYGQSHPYTHQPPAVYHPPPNLPPANITYLGPPQHPPHGGFIPPPPPPPGSYSLPVTPVTASWSSQQLHAQQLHGMSQDPSPTQNVYPSPGNTVTTLETGMIHVLSMSHAYGGEGCPLSVRVNVDFLPSPAPSPAMGVPAHDPGNKTLRIRLGPLPISTKLGDVSPIKTSNGGERYENLVMSAEVPSLMSLLGQKSVEGNVSFEVFVEVLDARGNILDSKLAGTFMYTTGVAAEAYGEHKP
jgi:hypothetical protein